MLELQSSCSQWTPERYGAQQERRDLDGKLSQISWMGTLEDVVVLQDGDQAVLAQPRHDESDLGVGREVSRAGTNRGYYVATHQNLN